MYSIRGFAGLLFVGVALVLTSCDSQEETGPYDCAKKPIPSDAQCFEFQGEEQAFRFDVAGIAGRWNNSEYESCIEYATDGTGTIRYWGIIGGVPREDTEFRWGVWIDDNGDPILSGLGQPVVVHYRESGSYLDTRITGLGFTDTGGLGGFSRVDTCPANVESNQGTMTFFTTNSGTDEVTVALDSYVVGELSTIITGDHPDCGAVSSPGIITVYRQPGTYRFQALSSTATWGPTNIAVEKGNCSSHNLQ